MGMTRSGGIAQHNAGTIVIITNTDDYFDINGYTDSFDENGTFVFQNGNELKCVKEGRYIYNIHNTVSCDVANQELYIALIHVRGATETVQNFGDAHLYCGGANKPYPASSGYSIYLLADDIIKMGVRNVNGNNDVTFIHSSITLIL